MTRAGRAQGLRTLLNGPLRSSPPENRQKASTGNPTKALERAAGPVRQPHSAQTGAIDRHFSVIIHRHFSAALDTLALVGWWTIKGVLWPRQKGWHFSHNVPKLLEGYLDAADREWDLDGMRAALAEKNQEFWDQNAKRLEPMFGSFRLAAAALLVEVVFWLLDLGFCGG